MIYTLKRTTNMKKQNEDLLLQSNKKQIRLKIYKKL